MPDPGTFLRKFKLKKGLVIDDYKLKSIRIEHEVIKTYKLYQYPITLVWKNLNEKSSSSNSIANFKSKLYKIIGKTLVIDSHYGNPYRCTISLHSIDEFDYNGDLHVSLLGHAERIYE